VFTPCAARSLSPRERQVLLDFFPFFFLPPLSTTRERDYRDRRNVPCNERTFFVALWIERIPIVLSRLAKREGSCALSPRENHIGAGCSILSIRKSLFIHDSRCRRVSDAREQTERERERERELGRVASGRTSWKVIDEPFRVCRGITRA